MSVSAVNNSNQTWTSTISSPVPADSCTTNDEVEQSVGLGSSAEARAVAAQLEVLQQVATIDNLSVDASEVTEFAEANVQASKEKVAATTKSDAKTVSDQQSPIDIFTLNFGTALLLANQDLDKVLEHLKPADEVDLENVNHDDILSPLKTMKESLASGTSFEDAMSKLSDQAKALLYESLSNQKDVLIKIVEPVLNHGPIVEEASRLDESAATLLSKTIAVMAKATKPRAELAVKDQGLYSQSISGYKEELQEACKQYQKDCQEFSQLPANLQNAMSRDGASANTPLRKFQAKLQELAAEYNGKLAQEDLVSLLGATTKVREEVKKDPGLSDKFSDWKEMIFSKEGFAAIATMLPLLAGTLQGALSLIGLGKIAQPLTNLAHGAATLGEKVFHMVYLFGQQQTNKALASQVHEQTTPPAKSPPAAKQMTS